MITWLLVTRTGISNTRFLYFIKVARVTINLDNDLNDKVGDIIDDIAEMNIIID